MKTQDCGIGATHDGHSWNSTYPIGTRPFDLPEASDDRFCNGIPSVSRRIHKVLGIPFKFSTILGSEVSCHPALDVLECRMKDLKKQLRTRDRKITKLMKENRRYKALGDDQVIVDRDLLHDLRSEIESAWWNCNGGRQSHQAYIDTLVKLGEALGEPCTHTPSGKPLKDGQAP